MRQPSYALAGPSGPRIGPGSLVSAAMLGLLITVVLLAQDPSVAAAKPSAPPKAPTFAQVVTEHFVVWDADANGTLSASRALPRR